MSLIDTNSLVGRGEDIPSRAREQAFGGLGCNFAKACVIEFEFQCLLGAAVPEVSFQYVFGSDEYNEYAGQG